MGKVGLQPAQAQGPVQVCSATTTEFLLFSPEGFSAKQASFRQQHSVCVGTHILWLKGSLLK